MATKTCTKCQETLSSESFYKQKDRKTSTSWCKKCLNHERSIALIVRKRKLIELFGGGCCKCGYNKCDSALEFHHIDRSTKEHRPAKLLFGSWEKIVEELKKCILLCSNCHRELHACEYNKINKDDLSKFEQNNILNREYKSIVPTGNCGVCNKEVYHTKYCSRECSSKTKLHAKSIDKRTTRDSRPETRKVERPSKEELSEEIKTLSYCAIGRKYGVSDNAVRKWAKSYEIYQ